MHQRCFYTLVNSLADHVLVHLDNYVVTTHFWLSLTLLGNLDLDLGLYLCYMNVLQLFCTVYRTIYLVV